MGAPHAGFMGLCTPLLFNIISVAQSGIFMSAAPKWSAEILYKLVSLHLPHLLDHEWIHTLRVCFSTRIFYPLSDDTAAAVS